MRESYFLSALWTTPISHLPLFISQKKASLSEALKGLLFAYLVS